MTRAIFSGYKVKLDFDHNVKQGAAGFGFTLSFDPIQNARQYNKASIGKNRR